MLMVEEIPKYMSEKIVSWKSKKDKWLTRALAHKEYFANDVEGTGTTFTQEQLQRIKENTDIPVNINQIYPLVSQQHAILCQSKSSNKVVSLDNRERSKLYAMILDKAKTTILYKSEAQEHNTQALLEFLITGISHLGIVEKNFYKKGEFSIAYQHLSSECITLDPNSKLVTNEDMEGYFYEEEMTKEMISHLYGDTIAEINAYYEKDYKIDDFLNIHSLDSTVAPQGRVSTPIDQAKGIVRKFYDKAVATMYYVKNPDATDVQLMFKENYFPEQEVLFKEELIEKTETNFFVRETTMLGNKIIRVEFKPLTLFPIKTLYFQWNGKPYLTNGVIHYIKGMNEAHDKALQIMLLNGILNNNEGWISPVGGIDEQSRANWERQNPKTVKEYIPKVIEGQVLKPERSPNRPIGDFYPFVMELMTQGMKISTGINEFVSGDVKSRIEVFSTLQQYQNAAMQRIKNTIDHIDHVQECIGNIIIQYLLATLEPDVNYLFFDPKKGDYEEMAIAKELIVELKTEDVRVMAVPSEAMASQKIAMASELMKISQTTADPVRRETYIQKAFELSDMRGFDDLAKKIDIGVELQNKVAQLEEQVERDKELMKQYENRALLAEYEQKLAQLLAGAKEDVMTKAIEVQKDMEIEKEKEKNKNKTI